MVKRDIFHLIDLDAERATLCVGLLNHGAYQSFGLSPSDYGTESHVEIATAMADVWEAGERAVDIESVVMQLRRRGTLDRVGGTEAVTFLVSSAGVPDPDRIRTLARSRALYAQLQTAQQKLLAEGMHAAMAVVDEAQAVALRSSSVTVKTGTEVVEEAIVEMRDAATAKRVYPGLEVIDDRCSSFRAGMMVLLAADSNVGKSELCRAMLTGSAQRNVIGGMISLEDGADVFGSRMLSAESCVSSRSMMRGRVSRDDYTRMGGAVHKLREYGSRVLFADCIGGNELDVCAAMSTMAAMGAKWVFVDYLQEIESSKPKQDRRNEIRWVAKRIKAHARRLGLALVLVSQITVPSDKKDNWKPTKHSVKESRDVMNMSEIMIVMWRNEEADDAPIHCSLVKGKWGGLGAGWTMQRDPRQGGKLMAVD